METDFIYWRHSTPMGIKVEEITGGDDKKGKLWEEMAGQIYCENGKDEYRSIGHFSSGAPFLSGAEERISISHTPGMMVVATIKVSAETDLSKFSPAAALGIDVEKDDRKKVLDLRERFMNEKELESIDCKSVKDCLIAWTSKEALYKAALTPGLDFRKDIIIRKMPKCNDISLWLETFRKEGDRDNEDNGYGEAEVKFPDGSAVSFRLYSYISEGYVITLAFV